MVAILTYNCYMLDEIVSCLQKSIRRNNIEKALFCGLELCRSGRTGHCWKRLLIITFEDISYLNVDKVFKIYELYKKYLSISKGILMREIWKNKEVIELIRRTIIILCIGEKHRISGHIAHLIKYISTPNKKKFIKALNKKEEAKSILYFYDDIRIFAPFFKDNKYYDCCVFMSNGLKNEKILVNITLMLVLLRIDSPLKGEEEKVKYYGWEDIIMKDDILKSRSYFKMDNCFRDKHTISGRGGKTFYLLDDKNWTIEEKNRSHSDNVPYKNRTVKFFYEEGAKLSKKAEIYDPYLELVLKYEVEDITKDFQDLIDNEIIFD